MLILQVELLIYIRYFIKS